jgi:hypothetical protein
LLRTAYVYVTSDVLTAMTVKITVFCHMTPCCPVDIYRDLEKCSSEKLTNAYQKTAMSIYLNYTNRLVIIRNSNILKKHTLVGKETIHIFIVSLELANGKLEEHLQTLVVSLYIKLQNRVRVWLSPY